MAIPQGEETPLDPGNIKHSPSAPSSCGLSANTNLPFDAMHPISYSSFTLALAEETSSFTNTILVPSNG